MRTMHPNIETIISHLKAGSTFSREAAEDLVYPMAVSYEAHPLEVIEHLSTVLSPGTLLFFLQAVGGRAVREAMRDLRMDAAKDQVSTRPTMARIKNMAADKIEKSGPYPAAIIDFNKVW